MRYCTLFTSLSLVALGVASPIQPQQEGNITSLADGEVIATANGPYNPTHGGKSPEPVTAEQVAAFKLYSQYAAASYCPSNNNGTNTKITCNVGNCPLVEAANVTGIYEFENSLFTDVTGFVGQSDLTKTIVLAFRGTKSFANLITDAQFLVKAPYPACKDCRVHRGFLAAWKQVSADILVPLKKARTEHPDYKIIVTGHSLGGAMAVFASADLRSQGFPAALYTYGQPRVGNDEFSAYMEANPGAGNFRITHTVDPVPRLPPAEFRYNHFSPEYWVMTDNPDPSPSEIGIYKGRVNADGNAGTRGFNLEAHGLYFGPIGKCGPDRDFSFRE